MPKQQYIFIGDSLVEFFNWQNRFPDQQVINFGQAGETAEGLAARLPGIIKRYEAPDLIMIMTGTNNIAMEDYGFLFTYEKIIEQLQDACPGATIVMVSLLPIELFWLGDAVPRVNKRLKEISQNLAVHYLDLYPLFLGRDSKQNPACFEPDSVHLSLQGYEVWADALEEFLAKIQPPKNKSCI
ncbi:MAG: GDSL family lipase [Proteobacteria bacterium]|nr:GDSL family lipase [Pseudomonadota bacterium]